ncbi:hypothetical protein D9M69_512420 [compost metagenome]
MKLGELQPRTCAKGSIEVRERFVEQERLRFLDDGAPDRHALALPTGKLLRLSVEKMGDFQSRGGLADATIALLLWHADVFQTEGHVLGNGHMRVERVGLEDHRDAPFARWQRIDALFAHRDRAARHVFQACDHAQKRRLAATRRPEEDDELACLDGQRDVVQHGERAVALGDVGDLNRC